MGHFWIRLKVREGGGFFTVPLVLYANVDPLPGNPPLPFPGTIEDVEGFPEPFPFKPAGRGGGAQLRSNTGWKKEWSIASRAVNRSS